MDRPGAGGRHGARQLSLPVSGRGPLLLALSGILVGAAVMDRHAAAAALVVLACLAGAAALWRRARTLRDVAADEESVLLDNGVDYDAVPWGDVERVETHGAFTTIAFRDGKSVRFRADPRQLTWLTLKARKA